METTADVAPIVQKAAAPVQRPSIKRQREEESENDDEPSQFRRVRIKCRQRARKQRSAGKAGSEAFESGEETIRCICGTQHDIGRSSARSIAEWLIQCKACHVWQHRSCVGFANGRTGFYCGYCLPSISNSLLVRNRPGTEVSPLIHCATWASPICPRVLSEENMFRVEELGLSRRPEG